MTGLLRARGIKNNCSIKCLYYLAFILCRFMYILLILCFNLDAVKVIFNRHATLNKINTDVNWEI